MDFLYKLTDRLGVIALAREKLFFEGDTIVACTEYATKFFGVSASTLSNWMADGCPRYAYGYWDLKAVGDYLQRKQSRRDAQAALDDPEEISLSGQKTLVERDLKREQLKALERQNAVAEGKLISREEAVRDLSEFCTILKMSLQSLGQDLGNKVAPHVDVVTARRLAGEIRGIIEAALGELSVGGVYPPPEE